MYLNIVATTVRSKDLHYSTSRQNPRSAFKRLLCKFLPVDETIEGVPTEREAG